MLPTPSMPYWRSSPASQPPPEATRHPGHFGGGPSGTRTPLSLRFDSAREDDPGVKQELTANTEDAVSRGSRRTLETERASG
jgi:hypothetical protein